MPHLCIIPEAKTKAVNGNHQSHAVADNLCGGLRQKVPAEVPSLQQAEKLTADQHSQAERSVGHDFTSASLAKLHP
jgi:hypothetical protein